MNHLPVARRLRSLLLPFVVALVAPFLCVARFRPFSIRIELGYPLVQMLVGALLCAAGLFLLVVTIRSFSRIGQGTLAPWDPPRHLVIAGPYRYSRNPMISGVVTILVGEAVLFGSVWIFLWAVFVLVVNTLYFKLSEERGLVKRFGAEYLEYRRNVPMWFPRLSAWKPTGESPRS